MSRMFIPGPVDVADEVLKAQTKPMLPHRSKEFEAIFRRASEKAQQLFFTKNRVFLAAASGTGFQEAGIRNLASESVLSCTNGAFGNRWYDVAVTNGKKADKLDFEWDKPVDPQTVAEALKKKKYEVITIIHNETSTGLQNPVKEIAETVLSVSPDTLILVDAVSSLGGVKIETDAWGLDMVLTSSQKCLALPPGLALAAVSDRAMQKAEKVASRGWYFDLLRMDKHRQKDSSPATPAMALVYALDYQMDRILAEGLDKRFSRHSAMAYKVQKWAEDHNLPIYAPEGYRSQTVTTIKNELNWDIAELNAFLKEREMRISNGYGAIKNVTFRIAHMGETSIADVEKLLAALDEYAKK